ncbi:MAG: 2-oxoisovalerate dehydrogenase beta subunit [Acidimicrobiaceae bacterium]|nr:2-oxoisovalerate dehydrogenase beta subunit [Acidimicrobiaceae bacterium]
MRPLKYWKACNEALRLEMQRDPRVLVLGEDVAGGGIGPDGEVREAWGGPFGFTRGLIEEFGPSRVRDTPISESGFTGLAAGLAASGYRPWVDVMFTELLPLAMDQLVNRVSRTRFLSAGQLTMPLTIKTFGECYSPLAHYPGLICVAPSDAYSAKGLTAAAIRADDPVVIFDSLRLLRDECEVPEEAYTLDLGKARIVRHGSDITLVGIGPSTSMCLAAADALQEDGADAEVVDLLTLAPWDVEGVTESVRRTRRLVVVDFDHPNCGLGATICASVSELAWGDLASAPRRLQAAAVPAMGTDGNPDITTLCMPTLDEVLGAARSSLLAGVTERQGA